MLSEEWVTALAAMASERPKLPAANGLVSVSIAVARRQELRYYWGYVDGVSGEGGTGVAPAEPALVLTTTVDEAERIVGGLVEPSVSYMRGKLKASGDGALLLAWLASTTTPEFEAWRAKVASLGR